MNSHSKGQLNLFPEPVKAKPIQIFYMDLNIHQKINCRANSCGFEKIYYLMYHRYRIQSLRSRDERFDSLTKRYFTHYYLNAGGSNRVDNYLLKKSLKHGQHQLFRKTKLDKNP